MVITSPLCVAFVGFHTLGDQEKIRRNWLGLVKMMTMGGRRKEMKQIPNSVQTVGMVALQGNKGSIDFSAWEMV